MSTMKNIARPYKERKQLFFSHKYFAENKNDLVRSWSIWWSLAHTAIWSHPSYTSSKAHVWNSLSSRLSWCSKVNIQFSCIFLFFLCFLFFSFSPSTLSQIWCCFWVFATRSRRDFAWPCITLSTEFGAFQERQEVLGGLWKRQSCRSRCCDLSGTSYSSFRWVSIHFWSVFWAPNFGFCSASLVIVFSDRFRLVSGARLNRPYHSFISMRRDLWVEKTS